MKTAQAIINEINGNFAVGVSGGADSMCLLSLVLSVGKKDAATVVNIDHGIREKSEADSLFVRDFCFRHGIKFIGHKIDVPAAALLTGHSIETEARIMRHAIFSEFCEKNDMPILLAHNLGDNAESILMHIFRGCGINGLIGMTKRDGRIIRPLIFVEKSEIYGYLRQNNIPYVEDETNSDLRFSRNRIRALILEAEKSFPGVRGAIVSLSKIADDTLSFMRSQLDKTFFRVDGKTVLLDKRALDGVLAGYYVVDSALLAGLAIDLEQKHIAAVIALAGLEVGKSIDLPHGLRVYNEHKMLAFEFFSQPADIVKIFDNNYGQQEFCGVKIKVLPVKFGDLNEIKWQKDRLFVDLDKLCGAQLRLRQNGDKFWACGGKSKKLKEFFNEKKVPFRVRDRLPLIATGDEVLVICGLRVGEKVKITDQTFRAAEIVFEH